MTDNGMLLLVLGGAALSFVTFFLALFYGLLTTIWMFRAMQRLKQVDMKQWEEVTGGFLPLPNIFQSYRFLYQTEDSADEELNRLKARAKRHQKRMWFFMGAIQLLVIVMTITITFGMKS